MSDSGAEYDADTADTADTSLEQDKDFRAYLLGTGLALVLTVLPFAMVYALDLPRSVTLWVIGVCALAQVIVHFRCFLHLGFSHQREDLQLVLFSSVLLIIMVAGTLWIMGNLATRMGMPGAP